MFESAELGHTVDDATYEKRAAKLRQALLAAQYKLLDENTFPVVLVVAGVDGAGKGETVNLFNEWMDPRHLRTYAFGPPSEDERAKPPMWRFWRAMPPKGRIGTIFGSWYTSPIVERASGDASKADFDASLERIARFEQMLSAEGTLFVKLWFHLSKAAQKKRLRELEADKATRWRVTKDDWRRFDEYDAFRKTSEHALRRTNTAEAPWTILEGADANYRSLAAGETLLRAIEARLAKPKVVPPPRTGKQLTPKKRTETARAASTKKDVPLDHKNVIRSLPFDARLSKAKYEKMLPHLQGRLNKLSRDPRMTKHSVVVVFEGSDAAGKGGAIRRITSALDARLYRVVPVAAPTEEERAQPYLWRFWRNIPSEGRIAIFDRSWYGRVLVERVEGFAAEHAWARAYEEINDFECELIESGATVVKFWLAVTKDEQLRRFKEREDIAWKKFKITDEDWRNRKKWDDYEVAACDMVERTSTEIAPWTLVAANDKHKARVQVLETLADALEKTLRKKR